MNEIKYPANEAEAKANRERFLEALRIEPQSNQCQYALYDYADVEGDNPAEVKHQKCAVGLAGQIFFGIKDASDLHIWQSRQVAAGEEADVYRAVEKMLGLRSDDKNYENTVDNVIELNDGKGLSFADIAGRLTNAWDVAA